MLSDIASGNSAPISAMAHGIAVRTAQAGRVGASAARESYRRSIPSSSSNSHSRPAARNSCSPVDSTAA